MSSFMCMLVSVCMSVYDSSNLSILEMCMWLLMFCGFWVLHLLYVFICDRLISHMTAPNFQF